MAKFPKLQISSGLSKQIMDTKLPDTLGFGLVTVPVMIIAKFSDDQWQEPELIPRQVIELDPSAKVLHYGQAIFEGMKAYKREGGRPVLFRPLENFKRFNASAQRMAMPEIPEDIFIESIDALVGSLESMIPGQTGESLYLRPFMIASQPGLGLAPSAEYLFMVIASPSGAYFSADKVSVLVERNDCRAAPGGTGSSKVAGNYGGSIKSAIAARKLGYHQTLWLDARSRKHIEELSGMNFFALVDGELYTPELNDSILPGVTRGSLLTLASKMGIKTHEVKLDVDDLIGHIKAGRCTELFACGTAAVITPISELGEADGTRYEVTYSFGPVTQKLRESLIDIQEKGAEAPEGWIYEVSRNI